MVKPGSPALGRGCSRPSNRKRLQSQIQSPLAGPWEMHIRKGKPADAQHARLTIFRSTGQLALASEPILTRSAEQ